MIPIEKLASEDYNFLIDSKVLKFLQTKNEEKVNYKQVHKNYNKALYIAYQNLCDLNSTKHKELFQEFKGFKAIHWDEIAPNAVYELLVQINNEEDWTKWPDEHKYLYDKSEYKNVKEELLKKYAVDIDFHIFKQWLIEREIIKTNNENNREGIKIIADTPIAFTPAEVWMNKDLFLIYVSVSSFPSIETIPFSSILIVSFGKPITLFITNVVSPANDTMSPLFIC